MSKGPVILFQGDSITDGARSRNDDPNHFLGHGYVYLIAAKLGLEWPDRRTEFINRGISGNRVSDLYARWNEDAIALNPDAISMMIGVNDAWRLMAELPDGIVDRFESAYRHLLDITKQYLPKCGLILVEPFILNTGAPAEKWEAWERKLKEYQDVVRLLAEEYDALFVPLQQAFNEACSKADAAYWLWDGVHPTAAGHELIAREWLSVIQNSRLAVI